MVQADPIRVCQVIRNLLGNAVKFSPEGGVICVKSEYSESNAQVAVLDEGPGVPEDELESVFDKFIQSSRTNTGAGGTGLGLAICREIIQVHGGRIWAENRELGAKFTFEIPLASASDQAVDGDASIERASA